MNVFDLENDSCFFHPLQLQKIKNTKKSDEYWIKFKIPKLKNFYDNLINPKDAFEKIKKSFENDGAIITTSINMIEDFENELKKKKITNEEEYQIYEKLYDINFEYTILGIHYERNEYFVKIGTYNDFIENYKIKKEEYLGYKTFYIPKNI